MSIALDLKFEHIRSQTYDGAKNMTGKKSGVKTQILNENEKAIFVHCFNHALNLAVIRTGWASHKNPRFCIPSQPLSLISMLFCEIPGLVVIRVCL